MAAALAPDLPFEMAEIRRAAARVRVAGVDLDDLASETALGLLLRARRRPEAARLYPGRCLRWAALDALRRLTGAESSVHRRTSAVEGLDIAVAVPERDEDEDTAEQLAEWRSLPRAERLRRVAEADRALGSSPTPGGVPIQNDPPRCARPMPTAPCATCARPLPEVRAPSRVHCSVRCRRIATRRRVPRRRARRPRRSDRCARCAGPVPETRRPDAAYCSRDCQRRRHVALR